MITEAEIRIEKTQEYLGLWIKDSRASHKLVLRFSPDNFERLEKLDDLESLSVSVDRIPAGEFRKDYLSKAQVELDPNDARPVAWQICRQY